MTKAKKAAPVDLTGQDAINAVQQAYAKAADQVKNYQAVATEAGEVLSAAAKDGYEGAVAVQKEVAANLRVLAEASVAHVNELAGVKNVADLPKLQLAFVERQAQLIQEQVKAIAALSEANLRSAIEPVISFSNDAVKRVAA